MKKIKLYTEEQLLDACKKVSTYETIGVAPESKITTSSEIKEFIDDVDITEIPVIFPTRKTDYSSFKHYRRFPIQLSAQNIILIHHFDNVHGGLENIFEAHDFQEENVEASKFDETKSAVKQFFDQLEGHYSDYFLQELIIEATRKLDKGDIERFEFSKKLKKEEPFESRAKKTLDKASKILIKT